jgi:hypothetical protein
MLVKICKKRIEGNPDPKHVSTSYAERQNLTMRMQMLHCSMSQKL